MRNHISLKSAFALAIILTGLTLNAWSAEDDSIATAVNETEEGSPFSISKDWKQLTPNSNVWLDRKNKRVILDGEVCLREGYLEMFACLKRTKEHESIVAVDTKAYVVHAALLALGAKPGKPVQFRPEYRPPSGTEIGITVEWVNEKGKKETAKAQDWILDLEKQKAMDLPFVFAGSGFWTDEQTGQRYYEAESGDFICVANFPSAMLDVPVESSQSNNALNFKANTERIPPLDTHVRLYLVPKLPKDTAPADDAPKKGAVLE